VFLEAGVDELHEMCLILMCTLVFICTERPMSSLPSVPVAWLACELARHRWSAIVRIHLTDCWTDVVIVISILGGDECRGLSAFGTSVYSVGRPGPSNVEVARRDAGSVCIALTRQRTMFVYYSSLLLIY